MADPVLPHPSEYDNFQRNFRSQNLIDNPPTNVRRVYDNAPYLILPNQKFYIKLNSLLPNLVVYIRILGELYGDPIPMNLTGYTINFYLYNNHSKLTTKGTAVLTDATTAEVTYKWQPLDIQEVGIYNFEFEFRNDNPPIDPDNSGGFDDGFGGGFGGEPENNPSFKLPSYDARYEIIVI